MINGDIVFVNILSPSRRKKKDTIQYQRCNPLNNATSSLCTVDIEYKIQMKRGEQCETQTHFSLLSDVCELRNIFTQIAKNNSSQKKVTIGLIRKISTNPVFIAVYSGAKLVAKELGVIYNVDVMIDWATLEKENVEEKAATIERFSRSRVDGIVESEERSLLQ